MTSGFHPTIILSPQAQSRGLYPIIYIVEISPLRFAPVEMTLY